jgi:PAS domain S-box-containing protein
MKVIDRKNNLSAESAHHGRKDQPVAGPKNSNGATPSEDLAASNARLAQENAQLTQERDLLRTLIDSLPDRIFVKDRQSRFLINNLAHVQALGATRPDEVLGKTDLEIFTPELAKQYYADDQALMESGQPLNKNELTVNRGTNEKYWLKTTKVPLRDKQGVVVGLMGISRDITEMMQVEESRAEAHQLLQAILDNIPDRIYFKDTECRFVQCNQAVARRVGVENTKQVIGKTDFDFYPREKAEEFHRDEQETMKAGQPLINKVERVARPDGKVVWASVTKVPLRDQNGKVKGLVGISRDITEIKQVEETLIQERSLLRTLIDNLPDGVYIKDTAGRKTMVNPADLKVLGCKTEAEAIGKSDFDLFPTDIAEKFWADDQKVLQGEPVLNREEYVMNDAGEKRWLLTSKLTLRDQDGRITGLVGIGRDITGQKRTEEMLRQSSDELEKQVAKRTAELSQERLLMRTLIDSLPDAIYAKDAAGRKTMANPADLKNLKCNTEAEAIGKTDFDLFTKDIAEKFWADDQRVMQGEPVMNREEFFLSDEGEKQWLLTSKLPLRDPSGKIIGLVGIGRDITGRKQTEETLSRERTLLRSLTENLPGYVYAKDGKGRFVMANAGVSRQLGFSSPGEVIGKSDFDLFPKELAERYRAEEVEMLKSGQGLTNHEGPTVDASKPEKNRWVSTTKVILRDAQGKVTGFIGLGQDITDRKQAEEALARERSLLRTLIDSLPDAIYAKDAAGRKTMANPRDLINLSCKTEAEAIGKSDFDLFPKDIAEKFWADDQKVLQGEPVIDREEYFLGEAGEKRWLLSSKLPLRDPNGQITGLVGIGRDITERKRAEDDLRSSEGKLRQSTTQLERSNRELQDFAYVASHDLQEPLRKIVVFGERLKEKKIEDLGPEAKDYLERMQKAASRMQTLINDLLTFSRVTTKARPFTSVDLAEVAGDVVNDLEGRIEQVKGRVEIVGTLPVIDAEALQMRQLLQNLMGNALKFRRPEEAPVVKVEAQVFTDVLNADIGPQQLCKLTVSDNGIGFDEKYLDRIFNVFQRLHTRNEYEGTGMGLAITKKIALYHGGAITAKSTPGQGSTFIVTLPVSHPKQAHNE